MQGWLVNCTQRTIVNVLLSNWKVILKDQRFVFKALMAWMLKHADEVECGRVCPLTWLKNWSWICISKIMGCCLIRKKYWELCLQLFSSKCRSSNDCLCNNSGEGGKGFYTWQVRWVVNALVKYMLSSMK